MDSQVLHKEPEDMADRLVVDKAGMQEQVDMADKALDNIVAGIRARKRSALAHILDIENNRLEEHPGPCHSRILDNSLLADSHLTESDTR